jgi:membrane protein YdbS with pleckstrin-like domain
LAAELAAAVAVVMGGVRCPLLTGQQLVRNHLELDNSPSPGADYRAVQWMVAAVVVLVVRVRATCLCCRQGQRHWLWVEPAVLVVVVVVVVAVCGAQGLQECRRAAHRPAQIKV